MHLCKGSFLLDLYFGDFTKVIDTSKPIIICASGASIPFIDKQYKETGCGLPTKIKNIIENNYSIGLNYWFQFGCETTFNYSGDFQFYLDNTRGLKKVPMILASDDPSLKNKNVTRIHDNTILLPNSTKNGYVGEGAWDRDNKGKPHGFFHKQLAGIYALNIAIALGFKEIYLLGYDCTGTNDKTHFYQNVADLNKVTSLYLRGVHKCDRSHFGGVGKKPNGAYKTSNYNSIKNLNEKWFAPFHAERKKIKIYNVSENSVINTFDKISYKTFFQQIENNQIDQTKARKDIKEFITEKLKEK